jgi:hypothetical protein
MKRRGLLGTFAIALSVALWSSWLVSQEQEVTLRYKFPTKETRTYSIRLTGEMAMTVQILGQEAPAMISLQGTMTQTERVEDVDKEGVATIVATTKGRMKTEVTGLPVGAEFPQQQEVPEVIVRLKVDPLGKVKEVKVEKIDEQPKTKMPLPFGPDFTMPQMQGMGWQGFLLPEKPVRPGDSWDITTEQTVNFGDKTVKLEIKGRARLVGFEKVEGRECAVIETTVEIPDFGEFFEAVPIPKGEGSINARVEGQSSGKVWFDIANGLVVKRDETTEVTMNLTISAPTGQSFNMSMQGSFKTQQQLTKVSQAKGEEK